MLFVFVGNDVVAVRKETHDFLSAKEKDYGRAIRIAVDSYTPGIFLEHIETHSLFGGEEAPVLLDFLSEDEELCAECENYLEAFSASSRLFVLMDQKPLATREKLLKKYATNYHAVAQDSVPASRFNTFALADAFVQKDKKSLWVLFMRAKREGVSGEELIGTLFWQIKALRLVHMTSSEAESGMKGFAYKKAKEGTRKFTKEELERLSESLLKVYHDGHFGSDIEIDLEKFLLRV